MAAFQAARGLQPASGRIDAATWDALKAVDAAPAFAVHTVADEDVAGPFVRIPADMMQRAKLPALGYESAAEALAEKFHMSPQLLREMNRGAKFAAGESIVVADVASAAPAPKAASIRIDQSDRTLTVLSAADEVVAAFPVSLGGKDDPLPVGKLKIANEVKNPVFYYDPARIRQSKASDTKAEIPPGPNNPVGVMWLGLSKPHWGIHGTPEPSRLGREETNGCVHLTNWDALRLSSLVKAGTVVDVRE